MSLPGQFLEPSRDTCKSSHFLVVSVLHLCCMYIAEPSGYCTINASSNTRTTNVSEKNIISTPDALNRSTKCTQVYEVHSLNLPGINVSFPGPPLDFPGIHVTLPGPFW